MPTVRTDDGVDLHYEEVGSGVPLVFVHEFAGDLRSYEPQMRYFARSHRCIAYNARGYPPSAVPDSVDAYSQDRAVEDIRSVLDGLGIDRAHLVGISMGGFATLHFGLRHAGRALSLAVGGTGYGSPYDVHGHFQAEALSAADRIEAVGMEAFGAGYGVGATRVQYEVKDPRGHAEFLAQLQGHDQVGSALTMRGFQGARPSLYDYEEGLRALKVPTLIMNGDEDEPCLDVGLWLKRVIPSAGLVMFPMTGHALNIEEPDLFNRVLGEFLQRVDAGRWPLRDPRSLATSIFTADE